MNDDGTHARVVCDPQLEIGPAHDGRAVRPYVDVIEAAVAERRTRTQVFRFGDPPNLTRRYEVSIEDKNFGRIHAEPHVLPRRSSEPRVPAQTRWPGSRVPADRELELQMPVAESQCLPSAPAEGPAEAPQLARHRDRGRAPLHDLPHLLEAETVDRRRRKVRGKPHLTGVRRYATLGKASCPRHHRVAAPIESRCVRASARLG